MVNRISFKNKKQNHTLWVDGEAVNFKNGVAEVDDDTAKKIKELENPQYTVESKAKDDSKDNKKAENDSTENVAKVDDDTAKKQNTKKNNKKKNGKK